MIWAFFAFLAAFFESASNVFNKKSFEKVDEYVIAWSLRFIVVILLAPFLFFVEIPAFGKNFWLALFTSGTLNAIALLCYLKAIKHSDLSLVGPLVALTPLFLLATSPLIVGETPRLLGLLGVLFIVIGSYVLQIKRAHQGFFKPFLALFSQRGPQLMLVVAFIYSITANVDKIGVQNSSPLVWAVVDNIFAMIICFLIMIFKSQGGVKKALVNYKILLPAGFFMALMFVFQMTAIKLALVTYVISIKRTSALFSVLFGWLIFKESGFKERLAGAAIMIIGAVLIMAF